MSNRKTITFTCSYYHDGARWGILIDAYDWPDAEARCTKLGLKLDGELMGTVPARVGFLAKAICWARNLFTR